MGRAQRCANATVVVSGRQITRVQERSSDRPDYDFAAGVITFGTNSYFVSEDIGGGLAVIEVLRTNGFAGPVTVGYQTLPGGTATPNVDYVSTNGIVTFADGQTNAFLIVRVIDDWNANRDLVLMGAYRPGADALVDRAIAMHGALTELLCQPTTAQIPYGESLQDLRLLLGHEG